LQTSVCCQRPKEQRDEAQLTAILMRPAASASQLTTSKMSELQMLTYHFEWSFAAQPLAGESRVINNKLFVTGGSRSAGLVFVKPSWSFFNPFQRR
jgi:hypothetical protein